jgi:hypothetical protein
MKELLENRHNNRDVMKTVFSMRSASRLYKEASWTTVVSLKGLGGMTN